LKGSWDAYRQVAKIKTPLEFAVASAEAKARQPNTFALPFSVCRLAAAETCTMARVLQVLLTLDQLAFYR
jgi:hypothetical protein